MLEKNKTYTYEEVKKIFDEVKMDVIMKPFGDNERINKEIDSKDEFMFSMFAMPVVNTMEEKLFKDGEE